MSQTLVTVYGCSDDLVEVEIVHPDGTTFQEEFGLDPDAPHAVVCIAAMGEVMRVSAAFGPMEWALTVASVTGYLTPRWPIEFGARPDMPDDPAVTITVPHPGVTVTIEQEEH